MKDVHKSFTNTVLESRICEELTDLNKKRQLEFFLKEQIIHRKGNQMTRKHKKMFMIITTQETHIRSIRIHQLMYIKWQLFKFSNNVQKSDSYKP